MDQFDTDDMQSEMLADDDEVAEELLDDELGDEDEDEEGIAGEFLPLSCLLVSAFCHLHRSRCFSRFAFSSRGDMQMAHVVAMGPHAAFATNTLNGLPSCIASLALIS